MSKGLWSPLLRFDSQCRRNWLGDTRVQRRCSAGDDEVGVSLVASAWTAVTVAGSWSDERGMIIK
jgi:hypothetical protein